MIKLFLVCFFSIFLYGNDLEKLLMNTLQLNPNIVDKKLEILKSKIILKESLNNYLPTVDLTQKYGYFLDKNKTNDDVNIISKSLNEQDYSISIIQNIFRGFKDLYQIKSNINKLKIDEYEKFSIENKILKEVLKIYFELYMNTIQVELLDYYISKINNYLDLSQKKKQIIGIEDEYFFISNVLNEFKIEKLELEYNIKIKIELLKELSNSQDEITINNYTFEDTSNIEILNLLRVQEKINPILKASELAYKDLNNILKESESNLYPSLDLELSYDKDNKRNLTYKENTSASIYLRLKYNVFNGFKDFSNLEKIKLDILKSNNKFEENKNMLQREIKTEFLLNQKLKNEIEFIENKFVKEFKSYNFTLEKNELVEVNLVEMVNKIKVLYNTTVLYMLKQTQKNINFTNILYLVGNLKEEIIDKKRIKMNNEEIFLKVVIN